MKVAEFLLSSLIHRQARCNLFMLLALIGLASGCSDNAGTTPVRGTVTYQGKPLEGGTVLFNPINSAHSPARAKIQPDGTYELHAPPGEHKIAVNLYTETDPSLEPDDPGYKPAQSLIPEKYSSIARTPLKGTVTEQETVIDLEL